MVERLEISDPQWVEFIRAQAAATPFYQPVWAQVLAEAHALSSFALVRRDASTGAIVEGIPVVATPRVPFRGRRLVSLPFTDYAPPLVRDGPGFASEVDAFCRSHGFGDVEVRGEIDGLHARAAVVGVRHTLALTPDLDTILGGLSKGKRRDVRAAERSAVVVRRGEAESDLTDVFFRLHLATRRRLGVPVQPKRFFRLLWRRVLATGGGFVLVAEERRRPLAAAVFLEGGGRLIYKYSATDPAGRAALANDLVLWEAIRHGAEGGVRELDLGRSDFGSEGLRAYKRRWGAAEVPLRYTSLLGIPIAGGGGTPAALSGVLRRAPTPVTRLAGELLYRYSA
jgi:CelD/BcsL family acetyltransferase involved in cellulose biosynthesis